MVFYLRIESEELKDFANIAEKRRFKAEKIRMWAKEKRIELEERLQKALEKRSFVKNFHINASGEPKKRYGVEKFVS